MAADPLGAARRLLRLWRVHAYLDLTFMAQSRRVFLLYVLADLVLNVAYAAGLILLAQRFDGIGAWSRDRLVFMLGYAGLADGSLDVFFSYNLKVISRRVGRGQLDHSLVQPQPLWLSFFTEGFAPFSGPTAVLPGLALLLWALGRLGRPITPGWLALLLCNLAGSAATLLSFSYLCGSLAFWAPRAAEELSSRAAGLLGEIKQFPLDGVAAALRGGLLTLLPAGFLAWFPCRALLGLDPRPLALVATPLAALAFATLAALAFRKGLAHYARTGSGRYLSFGFRR